MTPAMLTIGVLVVDPTPANRDPLAAVLRQRGYEVRIARSASDAQAAVVGWAPAVAIIDLGAPDLDGEMVAKSFAVLDRAPILIGILRTGSASHVHSNKKALFDDLFSTAASPEAVAEAIAHQIAIRTVHLG